MKVNDYVRSSWGTISRIKEYEHDEDGTGFSINIENEWFDTHYKNKSQFDNDYKSSQKIRDLIEVGDYVNGERVTEITDAYIEVCYGRDRTDFINEQDIKSIVTKEQFSQMEYRIGG